MTKWETSQKNQKLYIFKLISGGNESQKRQVSKAKKYLGKEEKCKSRNMICSQHHI